MTREPGPYVVQGDVEAAVVDLLKGASEVTALCASSNISTDLKGYVAGAPWVLVERAGGARRYPFVVDRPRIDITVRSGDRRSVVQALAQTVQAVLFREAARYSGHGVIITGAKEETGLFRANDKLNDYPTYYFSVRLTVKPGPA
jgi:hypothetical protein